VDDLGATGLRGAVDDGVWGVQVGWPRLAVGAAVRVADLAVATRHAREHDCAGGDPLATEEAAQGCPHRTPPTARVLPHRCVHSLSNRHASLPHAASGRWRHPPRRGNGSARSRLRIDGTRCSNRRMSAKRTPSKRKAGGSADCPSWPRPTLHAFARVRLAGAMDAAKRSRRMSAPTHHVRRLLWLACAWLVLGCHVDALDYGGKVCSDADPCPSGWQCDN